MRLLDVDGEYGCIASWVTPEVSKGGRKVVLHNEFQNTERELDQDEARLLFRMTGDYNPINDRHSLDICNSLWKESYIEKCDIRQHEILHFAASIQENIDEEKGVTGHVKTEADETGEYVTELVCEEAVIEAKRIYKERWRTYNRSTHPGGWTVVLFLLGVILFSLGATFLPRALISVVTNNMEWELSRFIFMILSTVIVFFCGGFLRDLCHGAVGRLFGARVIYKGFLNGSWFTDWYLIDDSVICGKYAPIQKMHIRLAGAYCDMLTMVILSGVLLHTGDAILYSIANGALFGVLIRYSLHFFPFNLFDGWEEVTDAALHTNDAYYELMFFRRLSQRRKIRCILLAQKGVQVIGVVLTSFMTVLIRVIGVIGYYCLIVSWLFSGGRM